MSARGATKARRSAPTCAICWVDPETGRRGSNEITRLCRKCKNDPENADWIEDPLDDEMPIRRSPASSIDTSIREAVRDVVRYELRSAIRDEMARFLRETQGAARAASEVEFLSVGEAATLIRVHPATIRGWIRDRQLPQHRAGRHYRVKRCELLAFAASLSKACVDLDVLAHKLSAA